MDDVTKLFLGGVLLAFALLVFLLFFPKPLPNQVIVPTEQVNAAVIRFENRAGWGDLGEDLRIRLEGELVNRPGIKVFTRTRLDPILQEQRLCALGLCDPDTAVQIGRLTGVNKLITGVILGVSSNVKDTQICKEIQLWPPGCKRSVPGRELRIDMETQVQILNAQTGRIEVSERMNDWASESVETGQSLPDSGKLLRAILDSLSRRIADKIQAGYTREVRYGFYKDYKPKGGGYEGIEPTTSFSRADGKVVLLVFLARMQPGDQFHIAWVDPKGNRTETQAISVGGASPMWIPFTLPVFNKPVGTWKVEGYINAQRVFTDTLMIGF